MSTLRTALAGTGLGAIVLAAGAPAATAAGGREPDRPPAQATNPSFGFSVSPASVRPGGAVDLTVTNCTGAEATAESGVFDRITLGMAGALQSARTTVDADARVGARFDVTFTCGSETGTAALIIASATPTPTPPGPATATAQPTASSTATATATATASATLLPTRGAQAGVGGTQPEGDTVLLAGGGPPAVAAAPGLIPARRRAGRHRCPAPAAPRPTAARGAAARQRPGAGACPGRAAA
ncbi:hypothetical protein [Streptomyces specialis]|uniref:hypothetical protein n=1 Tax=Streptomyces specialis TaxID=498367 RepID=UPI00073F1FC3|nr:hypothetical protein [Streptomyces specialis]